MPRRLAALNALLLVLLVFCACGPSPGAGSHWSTQLTWGPDVSVGWEDGSRVGPLSAAVSSDAFVLADSFAHRVLLWRREKGGWQGPLPIDIPASSALTAVAMSTADNVVVADAGGRVWSVVPGAAPQLIADLRPAAGQFRRVLSVVALPDGSAVTEVVTVTAEKTSRELLRVMPGAAPQLVLEAALAWADPHPAPADVQRMTPVGVRATLAPAATGVWVAVRGPAGKGPQILRLSATGRIEQRRSLPVSIPRPSDFLGVDRAGRGYLLAGAGTAAPRLMVFDGSARTVQTLALPSGDGPRLPHPVAVSPEGAVLVMTAQAQGLRLDWWPAGRLPRAK